MPESIPIESSSKSQAAEQCTTESTGSGTGEGGGEKSPESGHSGPQGYGVLPYASELFGVYQPLIGWKSNLSQERLGTAVAQRTLAAANAVEQAEPPTPDTPVPRILVPNFVNRTGTKIGDEIAKHLQGTALRRQSIQANGEQREASDVSRPDLVSFLKKSRDSKFFQLTKHIIKDIDANHEGADSSARIRRETAMATILHDLATSHPQALQRLFIPDLSRLERIKSAISLITDDSPSAKAFLSPVGILHLFREYFFQLGTFKGEPCGHVWLSPGSSLELVEVNTRRKLEERTIEESTETTTKSEVDTTEKDELSEAVKLENSNNTSLGASVSGGGGMGVWHASASASFSVSNARKQASEQTHMRMREQTSKLSNEIKQNYKTTFRTVTETTDTSSRRYVLQNTTPKLVSYELSRKMRKIGVQVQDLGRRLCWQIYVDNPGDPLGVGDFVYSSASALDSQVKRADKQTYPTNIEKTFSTSFPYHQTRGGDDDTENTYVASPNNKDIGVFTPDSGVQNWVEFKHTFRCPAAPAGFKLANTISSVDFHGANVTWDPAVEVNTATEEFTLRLTSANFNSQRQLSFDVSLLYEPTDAVKASIDAANNAAGDAYKDAIAAENETKFFDTLRTRLKLVSQVRPRSQTVLREEERNVIYRKIISRLYGKESGWDNEDYHVASEIVRYFFDIDSMLYFVAPDWWKPRAAKVAPLATESQPSILAEKALTDRIQLNGSGVRSVPPGQRQKYLITEETAPAPLGSSLGWLMQIDGDSHRNAFLNSPWVKAVVPMRPGREEEAIAYMKRREVAWVDGLNEIYREQGSEFDGFTIERMLLSVAEEIKKEYEGRKPKPTGVGQMAALPEEMVFSKGYDPLEGGTKFDKGAYEVFSEWLEVLPTDQVVANEWTPDASITTPVAGNR